jgi:hypothetical protein
MKPLQPGPVFQYGRLLNGQKHWRGSYRKRRIDRDQIRRMSVEGLSSPAFTERIGLVEVVSVRCQSLPTESR